MSERSVHTLPGRLIAVEGPDGAGKTVLHARLADAIRASGVEVIALREPGGCELSEDIRLVLKGQRLGGALTSDRAEALLFAAARAQLTEEVIRPALARGAVVLLDRWFGSSAVYQGVARGLGAPSVVEISLFATGGLLADRVIALQVSAETAALRRGIRDGEAGDRIEESTDAVLIRDSYARLHELDPQPVVYVSAEGTPDQVLEGALEAICDLLPVA